MLPSHGSLYNMKVTFRAWAGIAEGMGLWGLARLLVIGGQGHAGRRLDASPYGELGLDKV